MVEGLYNHPSIVSWVLFNEGWGQYDTRRMAAWAKHLDPTRILNATSGWADRAAGDVLDIHMYPGPGLEKDGTGRALVLGEFGGLGWPVDGHLWKDRENWGYRNFDSREALAARYDRLLSDLYGLLGHGLSAAVYTQTTDVEIEVNGLMTYDRKVTKFDPVAMKQLHQRLYGPVAQARILLHDSEEAGQQWEYRFEKPDDSRWTLGSADNDKWRSGPAPFASGSNAYFSMGTQWIGPEVCLRRSFSVGRKVDDLRMTIYHEVGEATILLNGIPVLAVEGDTKRHYQHVDLGPHASLLSVGVNTLAVHATRGEGRRQGIDLGLYSLDPPLAQNRGSVSDSPRNPKAGN
jgi:hypothetical protein